MSEQMRKCATCAYFEKDAKECRRTSPTFLVAPDGDGSFYHNPQHGMWPIVTADEWCGEHDLARERL